MRATVYRINSLASGRSSLPGLDHFDLERDKTLPADDLLTTPHLSLYSFDDETRCAVFVQTSPQVDLTNAPFYYLAQKEHARRVFTVPYEVFNALAEQLPVPSRLLLLHSVGRCGSTLLGKALGELGGIVALSEPDVYTCAVGMRHPDGSRDAELTDLLRSATRFLAHSSRAGDDTLLLKFRGWCLEIADLLYHACPGARALFLTRDMEGWIRSMGRLLKLKDPEREASYQNLKSNPAMFTYPRERYITLMQGDATKPKTRLEDVALGWVSLMARYLEHYRRGILSHALTFNDLTGRPEETLQAVAAAWKLPVDDFSAALTVFAHDAQAGTHLSGRTLRERGTSELTDNDLACAVTLARRFGLEPSIVSTLPGNLLA